MTDRPTTRERYTAIFGSINTRSMMLAGADPESVRLLLETAIARGFPATEAEMDAICLKPRVLMDHDDLE